MSDTLESLGHKINSAGDLKSVVRTMKVLAASNIVQYEKAVNALIDYYHTVEMGLLVCFRGTIESLNTEKEWKTRNGTTYAVTFGSDQGLVGQFNDSLCEFTFKTLKNQTGKKEVWSVGERMHGRMEDAGLAVTETFEVPNSVNTITPLIGKILLKYELYREKEDAPQLFLFYNRPKHGPVYEPVVQRLLPLNEEWRSSIASMKWPTKYLPEAMFGKEATLRGLIRSYLFVSLFRACAESLASENASRLAAMQRAEKNIDELMDELHRTYHRLRQSSIDEELFDVISGSEILAGDK